MGSTHENAGVLPRDIGRRHIAGATRLPRNVSASERAVEAAHPNTHHKTCKWNDDKESNLVWFKVFRSKLLGVSDLIHVFGGILPVGNVEVPVCVNDNSSSFIVRS